MERLSETQKRRSNSDDDFDVKKSTSSWSDTIAWHKGEDRERFCIKSRGVEARKRAVRYGKAKTRSLTKPHENACKIISGAN